MESQTRASLRIQTFFQRLIFQHFNQVFGQLTNSACALRVNRIVLEQIHILFDKGSATAGGLHNCHSPLFDLRPPGIDIATRLFQTLLLCAQMEG